MQLDRRDIARRCLLPGHWTRSAFSSIVPSAITSYSLAAGERGCAEKGVGGGGDQLILNVKNDLRRANVRYFPGDAGQAVLRFVDSLPLELPEAQEATNIVRKPTSSHAEPWSACYFSHAAK